MSLLALPAEIRIQIIRETTTCPASFESFLLACSRTYHDGQEFLAKHNKLRRRYRHFRYDTDIQCSLQFLLEISRDPIIANHIETADLLNDFLTEELRTVGLDYWKTSSSRFQKILRESWVVNRAGIDPKVCFNSVCRYGWDGVLLLATTIILSSLPNVRQVTLPRQWSRLPPPMGNNESDERDMLWRILEALTLEAHAGHNRSDVLSSLRQVNLLHPQSWENPIGLQNLSPLLLLPSLSQVRASGCVANRVHFNGKPFNWRYASQVSSLEKIQLAASCVDGAEMANLVKNSPRLRSVKFSYQSKGYGLGSDWDANAFITAIMKHRGDTLTDLSVTVKWIQGYIKGGLRSLKGFTKLEHLELDVRFFFGPEAKEGLEHLTPTEFRDHAYAKRWIGTALSNLEHVLPASIKTVRLVAGSSREDILILKGLFKDLDVRKSGTLPHLNSLRVSRANVRLPAYEPPSPGSSTAWNSVRDVVEAAGAAYDEDVVEASWLKSWHDQSRRNR